MTARRDDHGLEAAIDALYQGALEGFTADRNALAAELRKGGDRAAADRVKALAKPSVTAWAVNQVWWTNRDAFQGMLDAGARLKDAHLVWSSGSQADVRAAAEDRRQAVRAVIDAALAALGDPKTVAPDLQYRISGTVEALASGAAADATPGRLTRDLQSSGLEGLGALAAAAAAAPARADSNDRARAQGRHGRQGRARRGAADRQARFGRQAGVPRPAHTRALVEGARGTGRRTLTGPPRREREGSGRSPTGAGAREGRGPPEGTRAPARGPGA